MDFLREHNVRLIGTTSETIKKAEDRLEFKETMEKIGEPCAASKVVEECRRWYCICREDRLSGCTSSGLHTWWKRRRYCA